MNKTILIVSHKNGRPLQDSRYVIRYLMNQWQEQGFTVRFAYGTRKKIHADIVINHVDLTVTPKEYIRYFRSYSQKINSGVTDISKSIISSCILKPGENYTGPVIIKTNNNCGGEKDKRASSIISKIKNGFLNRMNRNCSILPFSDLKESNDHDIKTPGYWKHVKTLNNDNYPIFDCVNQLPGTVWGNKHLVVEKFMPELDDDGKFICRYMYFLGDRSFCVVTKSEKPVAKSRIIDRQILPGPGPDELITFCKNFKMDYGRLDYTIVNNRIYLFDANRTPGFSPEIYSVYKEQIDTLSKGINTFR